MKDHMAMVGSLLVAGLASAGLAALVIFEPPTTVWTALALVLIVVIVMGFTAPVWRLALRRIKPKKDDRAVTLMGLRFGLWSGIFIASFFLLKILGFTDQVLILAILALLIMIEMFLQQSSSHKKTSRKAKR